ncbi:MAG: ribosome recycling factor, partial [Clostridia bacterium]
MNEACNALDSKMKKTLDVVANEFGAIRAGRANPAVLEKIAIDYYGTMTPISQVGSISVPEPRTLVIQPWDGGVLKAIEKAIQTSDIGINPNN